MAVIRNRRFTAGTAGLGMAVLLLAAAGCTPSPPPPSATATATGSATTAPTESGSATATGSATASASASPGTTTASPTGTGTLPPDSDETAAPQDGDRVISSKITHDWTVPSSAPLTTKHQNPVPLAPPPAEPLPTLYSIGAGQHPTDTPPYDQLSFRFNGAFPSYDISYVPELLADGSGLPIPMPGTGAILKVAFHGAQAHTSDGKASTIKTSPPQAIGYRALTRYAPAGDFEGVLSYGLGVGRPGTAAPQTKVRVYEVEKIEQGRHLYVVAIQLDASSWK
ncbi:AMIN-like domain-containing (lipo)protein [Arthrobacter sp. Hor0625]|uniref:AMIN-like domain-containing (lipo)protein n=1 Tax=Arthrobacter sp. Hor0625 TaxID=3457358 RepID=UPI00403EDE87